MLTYTPEAPKLNASTEHTSAPVASFEVPGFLDTSRDFTTHAFRLQSLFEKDRCWLDLRDANSSPSSKWEPYVQHTIDFCRTPPAEGEIVYSQQFFVRDHQVLASDCSSEVVGVSVIRNLFDREGDLLGRIGIDGIVRSDSDFPGVLPSGTSAAAAALMSYIAERMGPLNLRRFRTRISEPVSPSATFEFSMGHLSEYDIADRRQRDIRIDGITPSGRQVSAWASCQVHR